MGPEHGAPLHFPDVPKLELDQLIDQLVERAEGVKRAQGRLRSLLRAIEIVSSDLALDSVLHNIVQAGCDLALAGYGALGVIGEDGSLEQFIHVGMDDATVARIGALPQGKGLLGALITDPRPIRLDRMSEDSRSAGFPAGHPPMTSFLGVPIRVRDDVFGNLYLTDSARGGFSAEDEELMSALALAAGTAISNARLYHEARLRQRWLSASVEIGAQLLSPTGEDPIRMIARHAMEVADADMVSVGLLTEDRSALVVEEAFGLGSDNLPGQRFPTSEILSGRVVEEGRPLLARSATLDARSSHLAGVLEAGPVMIIPLGVPERVRGTLSLVRKQGRQPFTNSDLDMAAGFASHASVALELADSRAAEQRVVLLEDRDRIARDLHDHVIQELFGIGMGLESVAASLGPDDNIGQRVRERVEDIDRTIRRIRTSIFGLRGALGSTAAGGLRERVLEAAADLTPALGFSPHVEFSGPVDLLADAALADDVIAVVREGLANIAKHARAGTASIDLSVTTREITVVVTDDGAGVGDTVRASGVANLQQRALRRGGSFDLSAAPIRGTVLIWKANLS